MWAAIWTSDEVESASLGVQDNFKQSRDSASLFQYFPYFLLLPRELRDQIYRFALANTKIMYAPRVRLPPTEGCHSSLVLTNRQLNREANNILYSENMFFFHAPRDMIVYLARTGKRNKSLVKRIGIMFDRTDPLSAIHALYPERTARVSLKAVSASQLNGVVEMEVVGYPEPIRFQEETRTNSELEMAIEDTLGCGDGKILVRKMSLILFVEDERKRFSKDLRVVMDIY